MTIRLLAITTVALTGLTLSSWAQSELEETRKVFQELVESRQEIANQRALWNTQKQSLLDTIDLLNLEIELLEKRIAETEEESTQAERDRIRLNGEIEELKEASAVVATVIRGFESRVLQLVNALPEDLKSKLERLTNRIPDRNTPESQIRASLGERMQNIVGLLNQLEVFNNGVHVMNEYREIGGNNISIQVLYIGLAKAFYVNKEQGVAGFGTVSSESGWVWQEDASLLDAVSRAISVYDNSVPAEFVVLPVQ